MMNAVQKYKVTILGQSYTLISDEVEHDIHAATQLVDATLQKLVAQSSTSDVNKLALLTALEIALKQVQLEQSIALQADQQAKLMHLLTDMDVNNI